MRESCNVLATKVIMRSPVMFGSLRASWNPNNGEPVASNVDIRGGDPMPQRNKLASVINTLAVGDRFSLANGQPYARKIEYEGHSMQAPNGMLRVSVAEWPDIVKRAVDGNL